VDATTGGVGVGLTGAVAEVVSAGGGGSGSVTTGSGLAAGVDATSVDAGGTVLVDGTVRVSGDLLTGGGRRVTGGGAAGLV